MRARTQSERWFIRKPVKARLVLLLGSLMAVELLVRVLVHQGIVVHRRFPTSATRVFWDDLDPHFGVWH